MKPLPKIWVEVCPDVFVHKDDPMNSYIKQTMERIRREARSIVYTGVDYVLENIRKFENE